MILSTTTTTAALPPVYSHTASLLERAAARGSMSRRVTRAWAAMLAHPDRAAFQLQHHLRAAVDLRSWERRLVAAGLYAMVRHHALLAAVVDTDVRDGQALWRRWLDHQRGRGDLALDATLALDGRPPLEQLMLGASLPVAPATRLLRDLGDQAAPCLAAMAHRAPLVVRANRALTDRDALAAELAHLEPVPVPDAPDALRIARCDVERLPAWREGRLEPQDAGSQRLAALVTPRPGEVIVDLCAGGGGKALALAAEPGVHIHVHDVRPERLAALVRRARRAGVSDRITVGLPARADAVLVDAPCSGSGTLRRDPCLRWRLDDARVDAMVQVQRTLLHQALELSRPGGRVIYGTCSLFRAENDAVVSGLPVAEVLRTVPHHHDCDGFFGAVIRVSR